MESRFPRGHSMTVDVTLSSSDIGRRGLWIVALVQSLQRDGESVVLIQRDGAGLIGWGKCLAKAQFPINNPLLQEMLIAPPKKVSSCFLMPTRSLPVFWPLVPAGLLTRMPGSFVHYTCTVGLSCPQAPASLSVPATPLSSSRLVPVLSSAALLFGLEPLDTC